jgi:hypothetical protein
MKKKLLWILAVTSTCFSLPVLNLPAKESNSFFNQFIPVLNFKKLNAQEIKSMLQKESPELQAKVVEKASKIVQCSDQYNIGHTNILTIIDYSLPSNEKRLWIYDIYKKKLLFNTYVSHGIKSGALLTNFFSNKNDSKASSIGLYKTEKSYYGREGLSLKLNGLDRTFNDNASNRSIVMHGGWYVEESFIKKYGRPGRSWGCPAVPPNLYQSIINTIKDDSLLLVYYPNDNWFAKSKFLNCDKNNTAGRNPINISSFPQDDLREEVLFAQDSVLAMTADNYEKFLHKKAPLERMLRRQIESIEYIAVSSSELKNLATNTEFLNALYLIKPVLLMRRGYYITQMQIQNMGRIIQITAQNKLGEFNVNFEKNNSVKLKTNNHFIRWLGL